MSDEELDRIADRLAERMEARAPGIAPRLLTLTETAQYLGRTLDAVKHMATRGAIPVTKLDGRIQIDRQILDQLIKARTV